MTRQDILGALQSALARGETLKKAMMTLYSAGYKKQDIEQAAAALQQMNLKKKPISQSKPSQPVQQQIQKPQPKSTSQANNIPAHEKPGSKIKIILIISIIIILIGILVGAFLFKTELISFFNNLFN